MVRSFVLASLVPFAVAACSSGGGTSRESSANEPAPGVDAGGASSTSSGAAGPTPTMRSQTYTTTYGGLSRSYILDIPVDYDASKSYPLVMVFHGNPGSEIQMHTDYPFDAASKNQAIVVYPHGYNGQWDLYTPKSSNVDMGFVSALVDLAGQKANIDRTRVYAFGFSGGAFFSAQLACRDAGLFAAIAVHSGGGPDEPQDPSVPRYANGCVQCPGGPVPTFVIHGQDDQTVPSTSGEYVAGCFATVNGCDAAGAKTTGATAPCERYACGSNPPVELCSIPGLDHAMWDQARTAAWAFFQQAR